MSLLDGQPVMISPDLEETVSPEILEEFVVFFPPEMEVDRSSSEIRKFAKFVLRRRYQAHKANFWGERGNKQNRVVSSCTIQVRGNRY